VLGIDASLFRASCRIQSRSLIFQQYGESAFAQRSCRRGATRPTISELLIQSGRICEWYIFSDPFVERVLSFRLLEAWDVVDRIRIRRIRVHSMYTSASVWMFFCGSCWIRLGHHRASVSPLASASVVPRCVTAYLCVNRPAARSEMPFHAICTPMHIRMNAITRRIPCTVEGETLWVSLGA